MWLPLLLLFSISMSIASEGHDPDEDDLTYDYCGGEGEGTDLSKASMHFGISLYKLLSSKTARGPININISPVSIYTSMAMLALGARSITREQIVKAMCLNTSQANKILKVDFKNFLDNLRTEEGEGEEAEGEEGEDEEEKFRISNFMFLRKSIKPLTVYQHDVGTYYGASIYNISFRDPQKAKEEINDLVSYQMDGKIENVVSDLNEQTAMILLDYASLNAQWLTPFILERTSALFKVNEKRSVKVQMMHRVGQYQILNNRRFDEILVEVPYKDKLSLLLLMPRSGELYQLEQRLTAKLLKYYLSLTTTGLVDLYIPQISLRQHIDVKYGLLHMGVTNVFSKDAALDGISKDSRLRVTSIYHKNVVEFAEQGTESSGVGVVQGISLPSTLNLRFDRPFLALVYNKHMKTILSIGRIKDPSVN